jgi:hypothetical protein
MDFNVLFVYFALGFIAGMICLGVVFVFPKKTKSTAASARKWSKVENIRFDFDTDHNFTKELTGQEMLYMLSLVMQKKIETSPSEFKNITISPGNYSLVFSTVARFIKRD